MKELRTDSVVPMSTLWLVPQLVAVGDAEAFHFLGQVSLYYQEFPKSLKSTAAAMVSVFIGIAFYLYQNVVKVELCDSSYGELNLVL
ncbi:hypothetical protein L6452_08652 [Arctium lappa]|uniref:Uncharacterized protein n=1 Tax=Arctium lappa TaxID=4217 RepID=A0ACB9DHT1_ARCLA|nr:hypothetical protein L6452_08652 [Arctium lappa]